MAELKLIALEKDDLNIFSTHLQDAVLKVGDLAWLPRERRFAATMNRFDWDGADKQQNHNERRRAALRFEHVQAARVQGLDLAAKDTVLSLLAIQFAPGDAPAGTITLVFAGDGAIALDVECVEGELRDLGPAWQARSRPNHTIVESDNDTDASFNSDT